MASLTMMSGGRSPGDDAGDLAERGEHARSLLAVGDHDDDVDVAAR